MGFRENANPVNVVDGSGTPIILPAAFYDGVAHGVPTEFVVSVISFMARAKLLLKLFSHILQMKLVVRCQFFCGRRQNAEQFL